MPSIVMRIVVASLAAAMMLFVSNPTLAQNSEQKPPDKPPAPEAKEPPKKVDEYAEAERVLGGPAANPECLWLGRRVVGLMWNDDLDTAFRHLDLYDRFGCPGGHIQAAFRCLTRFVPNQKEAEAFNGLIHSCWLNPAAQPPQPQASTAAAPNGSTAPGAPASAEQSTQGQA